ncbi:MAG: DUF1738 domain-containing protein [Synergistaceae bacterium]|nr:DUF1738 domain-containing protein [Synergistaceae bacterium]MBR0095680.1 DUF1738 domain-containing protein [Synergistaceae bacterium]
MNETIKKFREETTLKLIQALMDGTAPWLQPWAGGGIPQNAVTGRKYSGMNVVLLSFLGESIDGGLDPRWCTFKQATDKKCHVKKGAKGVRISFWSATSPKPKDTDDSEINELEAEQEDFAHFYQRVYTVFHASQIEGLPEYAKENLSPDECNAKADEIIRNTGADIRFGGGAAFYNRTEDYIQVPEKKYFKTLADYYATLLHEVAHWSGAQCRLNRPKGTRILGDACDDKYSREELVAEITSMFLSAETGIVMTEEHFKNHAAYIASWIRLLQNDINAIFKAAADASKAADFILSGK